MNRWWENSHLETDFTKNFDFEVESAVYDQQPTQRVYGNPLYDTFGQLRCRGCGEVMARSSTKRGEGVACCPNVGCPAHGFEFIEGSFFSNPGRHHGH